MSKAQFDSFEQAVTKVDHIVGTQSATIAPGNTEVLFSVPLVDADTIFCKLSK